MAKTVLTETEQLLVDNFITRSSANVLGQDDYEMVFRPVIRVRDSLNDLPPAPANEKKLLKQTADYLKLIANYLDAKAAAIVMLLALLSGCYATVDVEPADMLGAGAAGAYNIAPGSPAHRDSTYPIEAERPTAHAPVDVGVTTSALTLHSQFTFINSENGAQIWRSNGPWDTLRCFVMSQGSTSSNSWWAMHLNSPPTSATATHGTVQWKAHACDAAKCSLSLCTTGGSCTSKGTMYFTVNTTIIFDSTFPLDGYTKITCGPSTTGYPTLKRYTP